MTQHPGCVWLNKRHGERSRQQVGNLTPQSNVHETKEHARQHRRESQFSREHEGFLRRLEICFNGIKDIRTCTEQVEELIEDTKTSTMEITSTNTPALALTKGNIHTYIHTHTHRHADTATHTHTHHGTIRQPTRAPQNRSPVLLHHSHCCSYRGFGGRCSRNYRSWTTRRSSCNWPPCMRPRRLRLPVR